MSDLADSARGLVKAAFAERRSLKSALSDWAGKAWAYLLALRQAAVMALLGPLALKPAVLDLLAQESEEQEAYWDRFLAEIASGKQAPGGIPARASLYGSAAWQIAMNVGRFAAIQDGNSEERQVMSKGDEHCRECEQRSSLGWVPIGTLPPLGDSECLVSCRCRWEFR